MRVLVHAWCEQTVPANAGHTLEVVLEAVEGGLRLQLPSSAESLSLPVLEYGVMHSDTHHDLSGHSGPQSRTRSPEQCVSRAPLV